MSFGKWIGSGQDLKGKWVLFNPNHTSPPKFEYNNLADAQKAAEAMALNNGDEKFYILKVVGMAQARKVVVENWE